MIRCLLVLLAALACIHANADTTVVARRGSVISAQDHAVVIARRGSLVHSSCGQYEGIGTGSTPEQARRWFAVIRYR